MTGLARFFGNDLFADTGSTWRPFSVAYYQSLHKISVFAFSIVLWACCVMVVVCRQIGCRCKASSTFGYLALACAAVTFLRACDMPLSTVDEISSSLSQIAQPLLDAHMACIAVLASLRAAGAAAQPCAAPLRQDINEQTVRIANAARNIMMRTGAEDASKAAGGQRLSLTSLLARKGPVTVQLAHLSDRMQYLSCTIPTMLVIGGILVAFCATLRRRTCRTHRQLLAVVGTAVAIVAAAAALAIDVGAAAGIADFCRRPSDSAMDTLRMAPKLHLTESQFGVMRYWLKCGQSHTQGLSMRSTRDPFKSAVQRMVNAATQLASLGTCRGGSTVHKALVRTNLASAMTRIGAIQHSLAGTYSCNSQRAHFAHVLGMLCGPTAESARRQLVLHVSLHAVGTAVLFFALACFICGLGHAEDESVRQPGIVLGECGTVESAGEHSMGNSRGHASVSASQIAAVDGYAGEAAALVSSAQNAFDVNCAGSGAQTQTC